MDSSALDSRIRDISAHQTGAPISRRDFILLGILGSAGLGFTLSGCSAISQSSDDLNGRMAIIKDWLEAARDLDSSNFLSLHTQSVAFHSYQARNAKIGRDNLWEAFQDSAADHLEDAFIFGNEQMVCVQTASLDFARSHCYILVFQGDLIDKIFENAALYDISRDSLSENRINDENNEGLLGRIEVADNLTDALNERDLESFINAFHEDAVMNGFLSTVPLEGTDAIKSAAATIFEAYPNVKMRHYRTFGQNNLVCQQVIVEHGPVRSLSTVHFFKDGKVSRTVEYFSHSELIPL